MGLSQQWSNQGSQTLGSRRGRLWSVSTRHNAALSNTPSHTHTRTHTHLTPSIPANVRTHGSSMAGWHRSVPEHRRRSRARRSSPVSGRMSVFVMAESMQGLHLQRQHGGFFFGGGGKSGKEMIRKTADPAWVEGWGVFFLQILKHLLDLSIKIPIANFALDVYV